MTRTWITFFSQPSQVLLMIEGVFQEQYERDQNAQRECIRYGSMERLATKQGKKYHQSFGRHFNTGNICFLDGHVVNKTPLDQAAIAGNQHAPRRGQAW